MALHVRTALWILGNKTDLQVLLARFNLTPSGPPIPYNVLEITMKNLKISKKIEATFTKDQWGLYDLTGAENVAYVLNQKLQEAVNSDGSTADSVEAEMAKYCSIYSKFGSNDSEPRYFLNNVIKKIYG